MSRTHRLAVLLALALLTGCGGGNEHPPDQLLRDSLGLEESDQVFRVELAADANREVVRPAELRVPPGAFVEFVTLDRRLHTVAFPPDSAAPAGADFLRSTEQDASPPLLEFGARFVVSFVDAPPGRYPFVVEGNGEPASGAVVVQAPGGGG